MKRGFLILGSIIAVTILILASFPSVISFQASKEDNEKFNELVNRLTNQIQNDDRSRGRNVYEVSSVIQHIISNLKVNNREYTDIIGTILGLIFFILINLFVWIFGPIP